MTSHSYNENHTLPAMDPDPFSSRYLDKTTYNEWHSLSPTTIPEEVFPDTSSQRSPSPPKRPRNAKNLSLSVPAIPKNTPGSTSAPASPFRSPRLPSRRPSNLTINIHSLHRHPSTPELYASNIGTPIVASPAPYTSNQFPGFNIDSQVAESERPKARHTDPTANKVPYEESVEREKAYPDGPRLILEPNIWLYAEPDLELAKTYDVVVNVAREVGNPFIVTETLVPRRLSPGSDFEEATPSPYSPSSSSVSNPSPSLPSSTSSTLSPQHPIKHMEAVIPTSYRYNNVEYMHIPWDHHSTLSGELPGIVDDILKRSEEGKKVLVHCQVSQTIATCANKLVWRLTLSNAGHRASHEETRNGNQRSLRVRPTAVTMDRAKHVSHISVGGIWSIRWLRPKTCRNKDWTSVCTKYSSVRKFGITPI